MACDRGRFARDAVVVHGIDSIGGDVHLEERTLARTKIEDAFDGNAAQGQRLGKLAVGQGEAGHVGTNPLRKNIHKVCDLPELLQKSHIPGVELADVSDTVLHHGNPLHAHAEGEAADFFRVIAGLVPSRESEDRGIDHAAAQQLDPAGLLALAAASTTTEMQLICTSAEGSVKGKNEGKNRVLTLAPKKAFMA
jgi:hypothetical protein